MDSHDRTPVSRPVAWRVWLVVGVVVFGLAVAASSESVRIWTNPEPTDGDAPPVVDREPSPSRPIDEAGESPPPGWIGDVVQVAAIGLFGAIVVAGLFAAAQARPAPARWRWTAPGRRNEPFAPPLPDAEERAVRVDADAARAQLAQGPPRNAIVACWMQLERDVAVAGLPRRRAETSGEYVERVVAAASVDPAPIGELASLYREARFSVHDLGDEQRDRAGAALDDAVAALRPEVVA